MNMEPAKVNTITIRKEVRTGTLVQVASRVCHDTCEATLTLVFQLLSVQTTEAFYVGDGESKKLSVRAQLVQNRPGSGVACVTLHQTLSFCLLWHNITD